MKSGVLASAIVVLLFCNGCKLNGRSYEPSYSVDSSRKNTVLFGLPSQSYFEITDLFVRYLNEHLEHVKIQPVAAATFNSFNKQLDHGYFDFSVVNGMTALQSAKNGYTIVGRAVDEQGNRGVILVNRDSSINAFSDLKGKTLATPGMPALPGHMIQMLLLHDSGLRVNEDFRIRYVESFESVFLNVYLGRCSGGFSTLTSWNSFIKRRPEIASRVVEKWRTVPVPGNAILIRNNIQKETADRVKSLILSMHETEAGKKALAKIGFLRFEPADSNSYQPVKDIVKAYNAMVAGQKL